MQDTTQIFYVRNIMKQIKMCQDEIQAAGFTPDHKAVIQTLTLAYRQALIDKIDSLKGEVRLLQRTIKNK